MTKAEQFRKELQEAFIKAETKVSKKFDNREFVVGEGKWKRPLAAIDGNGDLEFFEDGIAASAALDFTFWLIDWYNVS